MGAVEPGIVALTVGTSGVVFATTPSALIEPEGRLHAFCHAVPGMWHFMGVMLSAAGSLQWYRDTLAPGMSFDDCEGSRIHPGGKRRLAVPALSERRAHAASGSAGAGRIHGANPSSRQAAPDAGVSWKGVAFGLKDRFSLIPKSRAGRVKAGAASGGGMSGVLAADPRQRSRIGAGHGYNTTEGAAYGAALLAGVGAGAWTDVPSACSATIQVTGETLPDPAQVGSPIVVPTPSTASSIPS